MLYPFGGEFLCASRASGGTDTWFSRSEGEYRRGAATITVPLRPATGLISSALGGPFLLSCKTGGDSLAWFEPPASLFLLREAALARLSAAAVATDHGG